MVDRSDEGANISVVPRSVHYEDCIDAFLPSLYTLWGHPKTKEVSFFDKPFTFERVALHVVFVKSRKNKVNNIEMFFKTAFCPNSKVINVAATVWDASKHVIHKALCNVGRNLYSHWKSVI